ncbi:hypothetical protein FACS189442_6350 [Spirochaetia bacterium]|nr:hypothetical protein FACS189442_6350 [Spirochaetia bacterium]
MKTIEDYMNDPAIADEPRPVREIHAARLMIQDERKGMTATEFGEAARQDAIAISKKYGLPLVWADLKPIQPVMMVGK